MEIGKISRLTRYPFKSMAAESLSECFLTYSGLQGDRTFALVNPAARRSFPWLSIREVPQLVLFKPRYRALPSPLEPYPTACGYEIDVSCPDGSALSTSDPAFSTRLSAVLGRECQVRFSERSMVDARPLSILSEQTLLAASQALGCQLDWNRFRANIGIDWNGLEGFGESAFVGKTLCVGEKAQVLVSKTDPRCAIVNVDPVNGERNSSILKYIVKERGNCMGVYGVVLREGTVRVGDSVELMD